MKPFIPYGKQWLDKLDYRVVLKVLRSDWLTQGPLVSKFEEAMANATQVNYALALSSGTAALHLAYLSAGIKAGDEVITTPLTFAATSNMLIHIGAKPVFVDIDPETLTIDYHKIEERITKKTKAISCVDFAGHPCEYEHIMRIARKHNLVVIADGAHSLGSLYKRTPVSTWTDIATLSFHPVKTITTGEGGMMLTNNKAYYEYAKSLRHHGIIKNPEKGPWYYEIQEPGFNYRLTDMQCALGLSQLKKLAMFVKKRQEIVDRYNEALAAIPQLILPTQKPYTAPAWHLYIIQLELEKLRANRKKIFEDLQAQRIGAQVHYMPLHLHPYYQKTFAYRKGDFPAAERYYGQALTLPLFPKMTQTQVKKVIASVKHIITKYSV